MVRAIVEAQAMAMRLHSRWIAPRATTILATGGAAANRDILQVIADVFDAEVVRGATRNSASLGAALRAYHAERRAEGQSIPWEEVVAGFTAPDAELRIQPEPRQRGGVRGDAARVRSRSRRARRKFRLKAETPRLTHYRLIRSSRRLPLTVTFVRTRSRTPSSRSSDCDAVELAVLDRGCW